MTENKPALVLQVAIQGATVYCQVLEQDDTRIKRGSGTIFEYDGFYISSSFFPEFNEQQNAIRIRGHKTQTDNSIFNRTFSYPDVAQDFVAKLRACVAAFNESVKLPIDPEPLNWEVIK